MEKLITRSKIPHLGSSSKLMAIKSLKKYIHDAERTDRITEKNNPTLRTVYMPVLSFMLYLMDVKREMDICIPIIANE